MYHPRQNVLVVPQLYTSTISALSSANSGCDMHGKRSIRLCHPIFSERRFVSSGKSRLQLSTFSWRSSAHVRPPNCASLFCWRDSRTVLFFFIILFHFTTHTRGPTSGWHAPHFGYVSFLSFYLGTVFLFIHFFSCVWFFISSVSFQMTGIRHGLRVVRTSLPTYLKWRSVIFVWGDLLGVWPALGQYKGYLTPPHPPNSLSYELDQMNMLETSIMFLNLALLHLFYSLR